MYLERKVDGKGCRLFWKQTVHWKWYIADFRHGWYIVSWGSRNDYCTKLKFIYLINLTKLIL